MKIAVYKKHSQQCGFIALSENVLSLIKNMFKESNESKWILLGLFASFKYAYFVKS